MVFPNFFVSSVLARASPVSGTTENLQEVAVHEHVARIHAGGSAHALEPLQKVAVDFLYKGDNSWDVVMALAPVRTHTLVSEAFNKLHTEN
jgi:hypothetical protein